MMDLMDRGIIPKLSRIILLVLGCALSTGCYTLVNPPIAPAHPTEVYLCDYGVHSSLLLPIGGRKYVEFLYGDWNWAALGHNKPWDAVGALCYSQQSTLGRRFVETLPGETIPRPIEPPLTQVGIIVNREGCQQVVQELMWRWEQHKSTAIATGSELSYVKDDEPYSWTHDCNYLTADCLREMGCKIDGIPIWSNFRVGEPAR
jgi:hypothetical protein